MCWALKSNNTQYRTRVVGKLYLVQSRSEWAPGASFPLSKVDESVWPVSIN